MPPLTNPTQNWIWAGNGMKKNFLAQRSHRTVDKNESELLNSHAKIFFEKMKIFCLKMLSGLSGDDHKKRWERKNRQHTKIWIASVEDLTRLIPWKSNEKSINFAKTRHFFAAGMSLLTTRVATGLQKIATCHHFRKKDGLIIPPIIFKIKFEI